MVSKGEMARKDKDILDTASGGRRAEPLSRMLSAGFATVLDEAVDGEGSRRVICEERQQLSLGFGLLSLAPISPQFQYL